LSTNTERAYRNDLASFVRRFADARGIAVSEVDPDDRWARQNRQLARVSHEVFTDENLRAVFAEMVNDGAASASRARMLSALRGFTQWLVTNGRLPVDPTLGFETPQADKKLPVALSDEQLAAVVTEAATPERRLRSHWAARDVAIVGVLAGCGIRSEELTSLRLKDVQRSEPHRVRVLGKGAKERVVPLSPEVLAGIDRYLTE
jgi:site-specific recombinase XerD